MAISDRIAVMDKGSVVQEGTAHELYYRPQTEFVANFIGRTNLVDGRVVSADEVQIEGVGVAFASGLAAGERVRLVVRPEMIELRPGTDGRVAQRTFLGEKTDYVVALGGAMLQVAASDQYRRPLFEIDQAVGVHFHADGIHMLR